MFANFAAKCHLTGPLRAVSPLTDEDFDIDWKKASKAAKKAVVRRDIPAPSVNSNKLSQYFKKTFTGQVPLERSSTKEVLQLLYVEFISLLIPLLYIASVLIIAFLTVLFFTIPMIEHILNAEYLTATYWACPAVLSTGILYLLMRPMFGGFKSFHGRVLNHHEAPAFMDLVQTLSRHLNVKPPKRIEINNETALRVDAYEGINSIYRDEYKIIIGAPLLMGMTLNQLAAMLAHELSHFRNKEKKIAFYLMHHVSEWLYFRSSGQDKRHQALLKRMQKENLASYEYAELWVWQKIHLMQQRLFGFMFSLHHGLTAWKCRQIELETDAVAIQVVGSKDFTSMIESLRVIQSSQTQVSKQNEWAWREGYLLDDYALAVAMEAKKATLSKIKTIKDSYNKEVTRFCPSDEIRLKQGASLNSDGLLTAKVPASLLLHDAKELSKELTLLDYRSSGIEKPERFCVSSANIRQLKMRQDKLNQMAKRYFDGRMDTRIIKFEPSEERDVAQFDIQTSIDHIRRYRVEDRKQQGVASNLSKRIRKTYVLEQLNRLKLPVNKYLKEDALPRKDADAYLQYMRAQHQQVLHHMEMMDQVFYQRAKDTVNYLDSSALNDIGPSFHNLELFCQVRREFFALEEAFLPLNLIVNGLRFGVNTKILQAGVAEKQLLWRLLHVLRKELKARPIEVSIQRKKVHFVAYLDYKLGSLPEHSKEMTIEEMATYVSELLGLMTYQYHKWMAMLSLVMTRFEQDNDISPVNLINRAELH